MLLHSHHQPLLQFLITHGEAKLQYCWMLLKPSSLVVNNVIWDRSRFRQDKCKRCYADAKYWARLDYCTYPTRNELMPFLDKLKGSQGGLEARATILWPLAEVRMLMMLRVQQQSARPWLRRVPMLTIAVKRCATKCNNQLGIEMCQHLVSTHITILVSTFFTSSTNLMPSSLLP